MMTANLRPLSAACSRLIGAVQGKEESEREGKQREWIWEFFLKNCTDGQMIEELMNSLPFPNDNVSLKRMLLLRCLSMQLSAEIIDELTLDILKGLGELCRYTKGSSIRGAGDEIPDESCGPPLKKRKVSGNNENVEVGLACVGPANTSDNTVKRSLPKSLVQEREMSREEKSRDSRKEETFVDGVKDWICGSLEGAKCGRNPIFQSCEHSHWELQLAVMVELTVQHLRGDTLNRKAFESALKRYWGDVVMDTEEPVLQRQEISMARDNIRNELWMVNSKPELLEKIVQKYTKELVQELLTSFLNTAWAETGKTFLDLVSTDVVNGKYNPANSDVLRVKKAGIRVEDHGVGNGKEHGKEKSFVRFTRGRFSSSREKLQKTFGIFGMESNQNEEDEVVAAPANLGSGRCFENSSNGLEIGVMCNRPNVEDGSKIGAGATGIGVREKNSEICEASVGVNSTGREIDSDWSPDMVEADGSREHEVVNGREHLDAERRQDCDKEQEQGNEAGDGFHDGKETMTAPSGMVNVYSTNLSPSSCSLGHRRDSVSSHMDSQTRREKSVAEIEEGPGEPYRSSRTPDMQCTEPQSPTERAAVGENVASAASLNRSDQIQVYLSPPPWSLGVSARGGEKEVGPSFIQKQNTGFVTVERHAGDTGAEGTISAGKPVEIPIADTPETSRIQRNLRRKQVQLDAAVQDPLLDILGQKVTSVHSSLMKRNATARTLEWEDEDDIVESPSSSPTRSRQVRLPPVGASRISPLVGTRKTGTYGANATLQRRKPRKWSTEETDILKKEVLKYGKGRWKLILERNHELFHGRTEVDLKDKWRNLERYEGMSVGMDEHI